MNFSQLNLCDNCTPKINLISVSENEVDLDENSKNILCKLCQNIIIAELVRKKISHVNIIEYEELKINIAGLERNSCWESWNLLWR